MNKNPDAFPKGEALVKAILHKLGKINKPRMKFMTHIFQLYMSLKCRYTFSNMGRYGSYSERSYRSHFSRWFDFLGFNIELASLSGSEDSVVAFDPTYLRKSGRHTAHVDTFYNGVSMKRLRGLELGVLALVDRKRKTALPLEAVQSHGPSSLQKQGKSLVDHYAQIIIDRKEKLSKLSKYLVVDGFFAKKKFILPVLEHTTLHIITMLRRDAHLKYLYQPTEALKRGRPKKYDGKVDINNLDPSKSQVVLEDGRMKISTFEAHSRGIKRKLRVILVQWKNKKSKHKQYALYCSTDLEIDPITLFQIYGERFQVEFLIRDAKQHLGLQQCQARDEQKLHFHFNMAFSCVGVAKAISYPKNQISRFSMNDYKTQYNNRMMLNFFFDSFGIDPKLKKNIPIIRKLTQIGRIAA